MPDSLNFQPESPATALPVGDAPGFSANIREQMLRDSSFVDSLVQLVKEDAGNASGISSNTGYFTAMALVMLLTGILGGIANYLNTKKEERHFWKSMVMGVIATITIPLFLKIVDSNLIAGSTLDQHNILVFAGFCVLAAFYSSKFLEGLSGRILQNLQEKVEATAQKLGETAAQVAQTGQLAEETAQKTDVLMDTQVPEYQEEAESASRGGLDMAIPRGGEALLPKDALFSAMGNSLQTRVSLSGKTGIPAEEIQKALAELEAEGKIRKLIHRGKEVYVKLFP